MPYQIEATEYLEINDVLALAKQGGMRVIVVQGLPVRYVFVPDVGKAGSFESIHPVKQHEEYQTALVPDPNEEPVVLRRTELELLVHMAKAGSQMGIQWSQREQDLLKSLEV